MDFLFHGESFCFYFPGEGPLIFYTQSQKKRNFSSLIFRGGQGQGHVTWGHEKSAYGFSKRPYVHCTLVTLLGTTWPGVTDRNLCKSCVSSGD